MPIITMGLGTVLTSVMTHEFGHWLALNDLYGDDDDQKVMYGYFNGDPITSDDILGITSIYGPSIGTTVGGELVITSGPTTITQTSIQTYFTTFYRNTNNNYIVNQAFSILAEYQGGEYVAATGADIIGLSTPLPYGYYWLRDANGNVLAQVKDVGTDNQGYVYTAYYNIAITGVPPNTTTGTLAHNEAWGGTNNLTGNVIVPSNCTLTILPNAIIHLRMSQTPLIKDKKGTVMT